MKRVLIVAAVPLALTACNFKPNGMAGGGNTTAAVPVTPDAVIVNGVTYVRPGGPMSSTGPATAPSPSATIPATSAGVGTAAAPTTPQPASTPPPTIGDEGGQPPSSTTNPDGQSASGH